MYEILEEFLIALVNYAILGFEFVGVIVLILSGLKGIYDYWNKNPQIRLMLAEGMALSLEFKLGSEILRTVIVREASELLFVGGIIILRAALTYLIHWEIDYEEKAKGEQLRMKLIKVLEKDPSISQSEEDTILAGLFPDESKKNVFEKVLNARFGREEEIQRKKAQDKYQKSNENTAEK